ncbi:MAG: MBOAT family O-acyltransferase [Adhaeribacter sp.]
MLFNSLEFLVFFLVVTAAYFSTPARYKWALLLVASSVFYLYFKVSYLFILYGTIAVSYAAGRAMARPGQPGKRRFLLLLGLAANLGVLAFFKYHPFFSTQLAGLGQWLGLPLHQPLAEVLLPIGLSFHTFQAISYLLEVYQGRQQAEKHPGIFALFVMFYPQLVAGPIERPQHLLPQLHAPQGFDLNRVASGLQRMLWGFFKKVVLADNLAGVVDQVYDQPQGLGGLPLLLATGAFALQIYCDFSGYTDIALGCARVMGFSLVENFRFPYLSASVAEFWRRWHISLSNWFRDYVYIPLGGSRQGLFRQGCNLLVVFLLCGIWHGASWNFVVWGLLHGFYLAVEAVFRKGRRPADSTAAPAWKRMGKTLLTFLAVCFAWIFFRAATLPEAFYIAGHLFTGLPGQVQSWLAAGPALPATGWRDLALIGLAGLFLWKEQQLFRLLGKPALPLWLRWSFCYALLIAIFLFASQQDQQFIYFQF